MPCELPNRLRSPPSQNENFVSTSKNLLKNKNWIFTVAPYFTWKLKFVSNVLWMIVGFWKQTRFVMLVIVFIYSLHISISFIDFPFISILPFIYHLRLLVKCILSKTIILPEMYSSRSLGYHNFSITWFIWFYDIICLSRGLFVIKPYFNACFLSTCSQR